MKRKVLAMLLIMMIAFPLIGMKSSQAASDTYIVTPEVGVNLRADPQQEGTETVAKLKQGTRVETLEKSGDWMKVSYEGKEGYIKSEHLKLLDIDLIAAYKHYATILEEVAGEWTYSLLYDFTQDGLEELYIVSYEDERLRHRIFSGETELFEDYVHYDRGQLTIYWDNINYYIMTNHYYFSDNSYKPSEVGIPSRHELVHAHMVVENTNIIGSGYLSLSELQMGTESSQVVSEFETNGEIFEVGENEFEINLYSVEKEEVTEEQWKKRLDTYRNAPNHLEIYGESEEAYNFDETVAQLSALYKKYTESPTELSLEKSEVEEIKWYTYYLDYMLNRKSIRDHSGGIDYFELLNMALFYSDHFAESYDEGDYDYPKLKIDEWVYNNFGVKLDQQQMQDIILKYETAYEKEHGTDYGMVSIEIHDESYTKSINGDGMILMMGEEEPEIINSYQLGNDFIALEFAMLGPVKELSIMSAEFDYIIVKKVEAANGDMHYPYIDTVKTLEGLDYDALNNYAEALDIVKDYKNVELDDQQDEASSVEESKEQDKKLSEKQEETTPYMFYALIIIGVVLIIVTIGMVVRGKRADALPKKSTLITLIVFSIIFMGTALFINSKPSQPQMKSDTTLDADSREGDQAVPDEGQKSNVLEDEASDQKVADINDEAAVRTFYDEFRKDYEIALNTGNFELVANYFEENSEIKQNYKEFVENQGDWDFDYRYTFLTSTIELEVVNTDTLVATAHEVFELYKQGSNPEVEKNERKRNYTLKLIDASFYISNIENLETTPSKQEVTKSTNDETKSTYLASIEYAENLWADAYAGEGEFHQVELKQALWVTYEVWDDELNRIYGLLKEKLSSEQMEKLRNEQRSWIKERDNQTENPDEIGYLTRVELLNDLTRERTLYLIDLYFD